MRIGVFPSVAIYCSEGALVSSSAKYAWMSDWYPELAGSIPRHSGSWFASQLSLVFVDQLLTLRETGLVPAHIGLIHVWTWHFAEPIYQAVS